MSRKKRFFLIATLVAVLAVSLTLGFIGFGNDSNAQTTSDVIVAERLTTGSYNYGGGVMSFERVIPNGANNNPDEWQSNSAYFRLRLQNNDFNKNNPSAYFQYSSNGGSRWNRLYIDPAQPANHEKDLVWACMYTDYSDGSVLVIVNFTSSYGTGTGDQFRFRYTGDGGLNFSNSFAATGTIAEPSVVRISKEEATLSLNWANGTSGALNTGDPASGWPLRIKINSMPSCGIRQIQITPNNSGRVSYVDKTGEPRIGAADTAITGNTGDAANAANRFPIDANVADYYAMIMKLGNGNYGGTVTLTDNMGNTSTATFTVVAAASGNGGTLSGTHTPSASPWASSGTLNIRASGSNSVFHNNTNYLYFSVNGSDWEPYVDGRANNNNGSFSNQNFATGYGTQINQNGAYYFRGRQTNGQNPPMITETAVMVSGLDATLPKMTVHCENGEWIKPNQSIFLETDASPSGVRGINVRYSSTGTGNSNTWSLLTADSSVANPVNPFVGPFFTVDNGTANASGWYAFTIYNRAGLSFTVVRQINVDYTTEVHVSNVVRSISNGSIQTVDYTGNIEGGGTFSAPFRYIDLNSGGMVSFRVEAGSTGNPSVPLTYFYATSSYNAQTNSWSALSNWTAFETTASGFATLTVSAENAENFEYSFMATSVNGKQSDAASFSGVAGSRGDTQINEFLLLFAADALADILVEPVWQRTTTGNILDIYVSSPASEDSRTPYTVEYCYSLLDVNGIPTGFSAWYASAVPGEYYRRLNVSDSIAFQFRIVTSAGTTTDGVTYKFTKDTGNPYGELEYSYAPNAQFIASSGWWAPYVELTLKSSQDLLTNPSGAVFRYNTISATLPNADPRWIEVKDQYGQWSNILRLGVDPVTGYQYPSGQAVNIPVVGGVQMIYVQGSRYDYAPTNPALITWTSGVPVQLSGAELNPWVDSFVGFAGTRDSDTRTGTVYTINPSNPSEYTNSLQYAIEVQSGGSGFSRIWITGNAIDASNEFVNVSYTFTNLSGLTSFIGTYGILNRGDYTLSAITATGVLGEFKFTVASSRIDNVIPTFSVNASNRTWPSDDKYTNPGPNNNSSPNSDSGEIGGSVSVTFSTWANSAPLSGLSRKVSVNGGAFNDITTVSLGNYNYTVSGEGTSWTVQFLYISGSGIEVYSDIYTIKIALVGQSLTVAAESTNKNPTSDDVDIKVTPSIPTAAVYWVMNKGTANQQSILLQDGMEISLKQLSYDVFALWQNGIDKDSDKLVFSCLTDGMGSYLFTVPTNSEYWFMATTDTLSSPPYAATIGNINRTEPSFSVYTSTTGLSSGTWYSGDVLLTFIGTIPDDTVVEYRTWNGSSWSGWSTVNNGGGRNTHLTQTSGIFQFKATAPSGLSSINDNSVNSDGNGPGYTVNIDKLPVSIEVLDRAAGIVYATELWVNLTVTAGTADAKVYRVMPSGAPQQIMGEWKEIGGGFYGFTPNNDLDPLLHISNNDIVTFYVINMPGVQRDFPYDPAGRIDTVDPVFDTDFSGLIKSWTPNAGVFTITPVSTQSVAYDKIPASGAYFWYAILTDTSQAAVNSATWQLFTIEIWNGTTWVALHTYGSVATNDAFGKQGFLPYQLWKDGVNGTDYRIILNANVEGSRFYMFKAVSGTGVASKQSLTFTEVQYDPAVPNLAITGTFGGTDYTNQFIVTLTPSTANSSPLTLTVIRPDGRRDILFAKFTASQIAAWIAGNSNVYTIDVNGVYEFRLYSEAGIYGGDTAFTDSTRGWSRSTLRIDTAKPKFTVASEQIAKNQAGRWVTTSIVFTFSLTNDGLIGSGAWYYYSLNDKITQDMINTAKAETSDLAGFRKYLADNYELYWYGDHTVANYTPFTSNQGNAYYFYAISGVGNLSDNTDGIWYVQIDTVPPTISLVGYSIGSNPAITAETNLSNLANLAWTRQSITLYFKATGNLAPLSVTQTGLSGTWSTIGGGTGATSYTHSFTFTQSGEIQLLARSQSDVLSNGGVAQAFAISKIETATPTAIVSTTYGGGWTNENVVINFVPQTGLSAVTYWYEVNNSGTWIDIADNGATLTLSANQLATYRFKMTTAAGYEQTTGFDTRTVQINKTAPVIRNLTYHIGAYNGATINLSTQYTSQLVYAVFTVDYYGEAGTVSLGTLDGTASTSVVEGLITKYSRTYYYTVETVAVPQNYTADVTATGTSSLRSSQTIGTNNRVDANKPIFEVAVVDASGTNVNLSQPLSKSVYFRFAMQTDSDVGTVRTAPVTFYYSKNAASGGWNEIVTSDMQGIFFQLENDYNLNGDYRFKAVTAAGLEWVYDSGSEPGKSSSVTFFNGGVNQILPQNSLPTGTWYKGGNYNNNITVTLKVYWVVPTDPGTLYIIVMNADGTVVTGINPANNPYYSLSAPSDHNDGGGDVYQLFTLTIKERYTFLLVAEYVAADDTQYVTEREFLYTTINIDSATPQIFVEDLADGNSGVWTTGNATFNFSLLNASAVVSRMRYEYAKINAPENWATMSDAQRQAWLTANPADWSDWNKSLALGITTKTFTLESDTGTYIFRAYNEAGIYSAISGTYKVNIDRSNPVFGFEETPTAVVPQWNIIGQSGLTALKLNSTNSKWYVTGWSSTGFTVTFTVRFFGSAGTVKVNGTTTLTPSGNVGLTYTYSFNITVDGDYTIVATNPSGTASSFTITTFNPEKDDVGMIDNAKPQLTINTQGNASANGSIWTSSDVALITGVENTVKSGVTYWVFYRDNWNPTGTFAKPVYDVGDWQPLSDAANNIQKITAPVNSTLTRIYYFVAVSGSGMISDVSDGVIVLINTQTPTLVGSPQWRNTNFISSKNMVETELNSNYWIIDQWTNTGVEIMFTITFNGLFSHGTVTVNGNTLAPYSGDGDTWDYVYTGFSTNGSVTVRVSNPGTNGKWIEFKLDTNGKIDSVLPAYSVTHNGAGATNGANWIDHSVTFNFALTNSPTNYPKGVEFWYTRKSGVDWAEGSADWFRIGGDGATTFTVEEGKDYHGNYNGAYYFAAVSSSKMVRQYNTPYWINIDSGRATIEVVGYRIGNTYKASSTVPKASDGKYYEEDITVYFAVTPSLATYRVTLAEKTSALTQILGGAGFFTDGVRIDYDYSFTFNAIGTITVNVRTDNGLNDDCVVKIDCIDDANNKPQIALEGIENYDYEQIMLGEGWTSGNPKFSLEIENWDSLPEGGKVDFYMQKGGFDEGKWGEPFATGVTSTEISFSNRSDNGVYYFMAKTATGHTSVAGPIYVRIDKGSPEIKLVNNSNQEISNSQFVAMYGSDWTSTPVEARVQVKYSRVMGEFYVPYQSGPLSPELGNAADAAEMIFYYIVVISNDSSTLVKAVNKNGSETEITIPALTIIDTKTPSIKVVSENANRWTNSEVRFNFDAVTGSSGVAKYQYAKTDLTDEDGKLTEYLADSKNWEDADSELLTFSQMSDNGTYYFRVVSNAGLESKPSSAYKVMIDTEQPVVEIVGYSIGRNGTFVQSSTMPNSSAFLTNSNMVVYLKVTYGQSGGVITMASASGDLQTITNGPNGATHWYEFTDNGSITVTAKSGGGTDSEILQISVNNISRVAPTITGTSGGEDLTPAQLTGGMLGSNVEIFIENFSALDSVKVYDSEGKEISPEFANGRTVFSSNGSYRIVATDKAGNQTVVYFTVDKPAYGLIISSSVGGVALTSALVWFILVSRRNKKALIRLIANTSGSDAQNQFVLFKKAK